MEGLTEDQSIQGELFKKAIDETFKKYESVFRALAKRDTEPRDSDYGGQYKTILINRNSPSSLKNLS